MITSDLIITHSAPDSPQVYHVTANPQAPCPAEALDWADRVALAGGTLGPNSLNIACALIAQMKTRSYFSKLLWFLPLLGANDAAWSVPLIKIPVGGGPGGFSGGTRTGGQSTGLSSTKLYNCGFDRTQIWGSPTNRGGMGAWMLNIDTSETHRIMGVENGGSENMILMVDATSANGAWGEFGAGKSADYNAPQSPGLFHFRAASLTDKRLYKDGAAVGSVGNVATTAPGGGLQLCAFGYNTQFSFNFNNHSTFGCFYFTDGNETPGEIADLHADIRDFLMIPTGRI